MGQQPHVTIRREGDDRSFEIALDIATDVDSLWRALSEGEEISKWFAMDARIDRDASGQPSDVWLSWGPAYEGSSKIELWETGQRMRTSSEREVEGRAVKVIVDYIIEAQSGGTTRLRIVNSGYGNQASWDDEFDAISSGWKIFIMNLGHYLERHRGKPVLNEWVVVPTRANMTPQRAWNALLGEGAPIATPEGLRVGAPAMITLPGGQTLHVEIDLCFDARVFGGRVRELDDGLVRFTFGDLFKAVELTLLAYGVDRSDYQRARDGLRAMIDARVG